MSSSVMTSGRGGGMGGKMVIAIKKGEDSHIDIE